MTPYQLQIAVKVFNQKQFQKREDTIAEAWIIAKLQRAAKIPSLEKLLGKSQSKKNMTPEEMFKKVKLLNKAFGGEVK